MIVFSPLGHDNDNDHKSRIKDNSEDPTEEQLEWYRRKMPNDPFINRSSQNSNNKEYDDIGDDDKPQLDKEVDSKIQDHKDIDLTNKKPKKIDIQKRAEESQAIVILKIAKQNSKIFVDQYNCHFAAIVYNGHFEILQLNSKRYRNWLYKIYYDQEQSVVNSESVSNVINILTAEAEFGSVKKYLNLRVADDKNMIYYDLTNFKWEIIRITGNSWSIDNSRNMIFRRFSNQSEQVSPSKDYPIDIIDRFIGLFNIKSEQDKLLLKCYIIALFIPNIPKPILILHGEQGSAKTTLQILIKKLVDPCGVDTHSFPRDINELIQLLSHNYIAVFDNISNMKEWVSDELCKAVTGSGFSKRILYTDDDDMIYNFKRCVFLNGINIAATKADLLDRSLIIGVERITKHNNRKLEDIFSEFEKMKSQLLAYIFDVLVMYLNFKEKKNIKLENYPRMADFAEAAEIISRCIGKEENSFLSAYYQNIEFQNEIAIESNPIATVIIEFLNVYHRWQGTATELLSRFNEIAKDGLKINIERMSIWPKSPASLSRRLKEVATNLREIGIVIERPVDTRTNTRLVSIRKMAPGEQLLRHHLDQKQPSLEYFRDN